MSSTSLLPCLWPPTRLPVPSGPHFARPARPGLRCPARGENGFGRSRYSGVQKTYEGFLSGAPGRSYEFL